MIVNCIVFSKNELINVKIKIIKNADWWEVLFISHFNQENKSSITFRNDYFNSYDEARMFV